MAIEFIAPITAQNLPFVALAERLQSEGICVTESVTPAEARFRWPESQRRENWPEDAELSIVENGLLLTIYTGTKRQESQLVENVALIVSELLNKPVNFEEV